MRFDRPLLLVAPCVGIVIGETVAVAMGISDGGGAGKAMFGVLIAWIIGWRPQE